MAKKVNNIAEVKVYINGKEQAKRDLEDLTKKAEEFKTRIDETRKSIADNSAKYTEARERANASTEGTKEHSVAVMDMLDAQKAIDKAQIELKDLENGRKQLRKVIRETEKFAKDLAEDLDNLSGQNIVRLKEMMRQLDAIRTKLDPETDKDGTFLDYLNDAYNRVMDTIKNKKGELIEFADIMDDLTNIDDTSLAKAEQRLRSLLAATDKDDVERIKQLTDELDKTVGEKNRRTTVAAQDVQAKVEDGSWKGTIEETQQAIKLQEEYRKLLKTTDAEGLKKVEETIAGLNKKMEEFNKKRANETLGKNLMLAGATEIKQSVDYLTKYRGTLHPLSKEWESVGKKIEAGNARLKELTEVSKYKTMTAQFSHLKDLSVNALSEQKKYWESVRDNAEQGTKAYDEAVKKLQSIEKLETGRKKDTASSVMTNLSGSSVAQIREAVKATTELRDAQKPGSKAWQEYGEQIKNANEYLESFDNKTKKAESMDVLTKNLDTSSTQEIKSSVDFLTKYRDTLKPLSAEWVKVNNAIEEGTTKLQEYTDKSKLQSMTSQFKQLGDLSKSALSDQKKYWQEMVDGAAAGSKELSTYEARLKKVNEEEQKRTKAKAGKVMDNLSDYSVNEIQAAIKATEQLRDAQKPGSKAWRDYADQVKKATDYLDSFKNKAKVESMNAQFKELGKLSADALAEQKKYWQAMMNGAGNGSKELEQYKKKLAEVTEEERKRTAASVKDVMTNPAKYSVSEIQAAIKATEQLRDAQRPGSKEWETYANQVANAGKVLDGFKDKAKMEGMYAQFKRIRDLSKSALAEQKKYWQAVVDGAEKSDPKLKTYEDRLRRIVKEEKERTQDSGRELTKSILSGSWTGTIGESKEAVKVLKEYKDTLNTTDVSSIKRVDKAISELTNKTKIAEAGFKNTSEALSKMWRQTKYLGYGNWKGSIAELEEMRRKLIAIRDTQDKVLSAKDRDRLLQSLKNVDKEIAILKGDAIDINHILLHMKDTPLWKLEKAAEQLKQELRECSENTKDFADKAAQLRRVNKQVETLHKRFKETENVIVRTAKRLMAYVAVYGGFNYAKDKVIEMAKANLQLSDTFADVQKTTGLASDEMKELSKSIDSIDTRTSQQQLHELAAVAGQLGLKSQTDILGFVKASNMISVSLNELGSEGTASLMKIATLTGEASQGTEKALLSIGSAINELTANSAATAGPIADLMARMGGVASQAGLTSAQLAAIGATADALGQSMEITGTSMNKFVTTLMSSSDNIAYALNMDAKVLRDMLNEGKTMEAMIAIFERMQGMGGMDQLAGVMKELGSEGARMTQVLTALASNVDFLKSQVELSTDAYREATSIQQEYNIKNENALALWQRLGNTLREQVVNSKAVGVLESISRAIFNLVNSILEGGRATRIFTSLIWGLTAALIAQRIAWVKNMNALKFAKGWQALMATIDALTASIHRNIVAMTTSTGRMGLWSKMVTSATMTWKRFLVVLRANWLTAIIASVAALVGWFVKLVTYTSELTRATARYRREVEEEKNQVDALFLSLQRANKESNNRAKIIEQINRKYGDYLGFMLSEKDSADKLAAAHKLINSELEKRMALNLQSTLQGKAANTYAEKYEEETTDIERSIKGEGLFNSDKFKNLVNPAEVNAFINKLVNDAVSNAIDTSGEFRKLGELDMNEVMGNIKVQLQDKFNTDKDKELFRDAFSQQEGLGGMLFGQIKGNIENLLEARIDLMEDTFAAEQAAEVEMGRITQSAIKDREAMLEQIEKDYNDLSKINVSTKSESEQKEHYAQMLDNAQDYVDNATKILREIPEAEREITNDQLNANINKYKEQVKILAPLADVDPWGKSMNLDNWTTFADIIKNLDTASADSLVAAYKKLKEESAQIPSNVQKFYKMFEGTGLETTLKLKDPKDVAKTVHDWAEQIKAKLNEKYGRNTTGDFIFDSEGSDRKKANELYKEWLAALEAYYNERETLIRQKGQEHNKLESEINRELEALNAEKLADQRELGEGLLNDMYKGSTFDPKKFKGVITGTDYFANLTLEHMRSIVSAGGPKLDAEVRKNLTERMVKIEEQAYKIKQRINKILLEDDFTGKIAKQYTDSLDELGLLFNVSTEAMADHSEEEGERRLTYMKEWAKEAYMIDSQGLENLIASNEAFSKWRIGRTQEDYDALLVMLRKYHDDMAEAENRAAQRRKRILDKEWGAKSSDTGSEAPAQKKQVSQGTLDTAHGLVSKLDDKQIKDLQEKIEKNEELIKTINKRKKAEIKAAKESIVVAGQELNMAKLTGQNVQERTEAFEAAKRNYETLTSGIAHASSLIDGYKQEIQNRIREIMETENESSEQMLELLQKAIDKDKEYLTSISKRKREEIDAARRTMVLAEMELKMAQQSGVGIEQRAEAYEMAKKKFDALAKSILEASDRLAKNEKAYQEIANKPVSNKSQSRLEAADEKIKGEETDLKMYESARDLGLASDRRVEDAQIAVLQAKIDKEQEYIKFIYERMQAEIDAAYLQKVNAEMYYEALEKMGMADEKAKNNKFAAEQAYQSLIKQRDQITQESGEKIKEYELDIEAVQSQTAQRKMEALKGYTDAVVSFGEQMGEAAFGEVEDRKEAARQLLKTTLQLTKDLLMAEAQRLIMKKVLGQKEIAQEQTKETTITATKGSSAITNLTVETAETGGKIALGQAGGAAKIIGELGWWGIPLIAVINAALSALMGAAMSAVSKSKDEIASATGGRKLSTGMLTYAEGNYPVLGDDGKVYDAKYEGAGMKTGVYGGGAHFGIFSEKQPEMIVDGKTTQKLILNYPYIYDAITTIAKNGRLKNAMPTFASGDYPAGMKQLAPVAALDNTSENSEQMDRMTSALEQSQAVNRQLLKLLQGGITAHLDGLETHRQQKKNERFLKRRGID